MKTTIRHYRMNGMDFIAISQTKRHISQKYLEKLAGFELRDNADLYIYRYGFLRVCNNAGSWRKIVVDT